jgi:hypothetical protein
MIRLELASTFAAVVAASPGAYNLAGTYASARVAFREHGCVCLLPPRHRQRVVGGCDP